MRGKVRIYFAYVVSNNEYIPLKQIIKILVFFLFELQIFSRINVTKSFKGTSKPCI